MFFVGLGAYPVGFEGKKCNRGGGHFHWNGGVKKSNARIEKGQWGALKKSGGGIV